MNRAGVTTTAGGQIPGELRDELARCERALGTVTPVLQHLLNDTDQSLYHEEVVARMRGMFDALAEQLARAFDAPQSEPADAPVDLELLDRLSIALAENAPLLAHLHALAIEWRLTVRLEAERKLDVVLTPLVQALVAADEPQTAAGAMAFLAAQSRYAQAMRRMQLPLEELPAALLHAALGCLRKAMGQRAEERRRAQAAIRDIQERYDEARTRLGLAAALLVDRDARQAARDPQAAGIALFASALALDAQKDRDLVVLTASEGLGARLAVLLRAAGVDQERTERTVLALHPNASLPEGIALIDRHTAGTLINIGVAGAGR